MYLRFFVILSLIINIFKLSATDNIEARIFREKQIVLQQMFKNISCTLDTSYQGTSFGLVHDYLLNEFPVYSGFICSIRYLGGTNNFLSTERGSDFMTSRARHATAERHGAFFDVNVYADSVFADAIGDNTLESIRALGNGSLTEGYNIMRDFIGYNFPTVSHAFGHLAMNFVISTFSDGMIGSSINEDGSINASGTVEDGNIYYMVSETLRALFLDGDVTLNNIGVEDIEAADEANFRENLIAEVFQINNINTANINTRFDEYVREQLQNINKKTNYGICPYFSVKFGYFLDEIASQLYFKLGITQLQGSVISANDFINVSNKFKVVTPLIGIGLNKQINEKIGISAEISHAFKAKKKFEDIKYYGYSVENKVKLSKTTFKILATYHF